MQLSLLNRPARGRDDERRGSPSTLPGAWRDSAVSQLDAIAAANDRRAATRLRTQAALFALLGLLALAASGWWARGERKPPPAVPSASAVSGATASAGSVSAAKVQAPAPTPIAPVASPVVESPAASAAPAIEPGAGQVKARAAPPAAERRARELASPAASVVRPREANVLPPEDEPTPPAPPVAPAVASPRSEVAQPAPSATAHADVRSLCAGSGLLAAGFCQARECRKAEHQSDPVCVRLREIDQARERAASER